jgi:hypothetical protein
MMPASFCTCARWSRVFVWSLLLVLGCTGTFAAEPEVDADEADEEVVEVELAPDDVFGHVLSAGRSRDYSALHGFLDESYTRHICRPDFVEQLERVNFAINSGFVRRQVAFVNGGYLVVECITETEGRESRRMEVLFYVIVEPSGAEVDSDAPPGSWRLLNFPFTGDVLPEFMVPAWIAGGCAGRAAA